MIDMITSLGADEQKVILTGTALSNKFNLLDGKKNTPGSASTGVPSVITYQQVKTIINSLKFYQSLHNNRFIHILNAQLHLKTKKKLFSFDRYVNP